MIEPAALPKIDIHDSYERAPMSEATRALLCVFAAGPCDRPLPRLAIDWEQVFQSVRRNSLIGLTHYYLDRQTHLDASALEFKQQIDQAYRALVIRMARVYQNISRVLSELADARLEYIVVKGPALAYGVYPDPTLRSFNDLDLIVRERDWNMAYRLLTEMGFRQEGNCPQPPPKLIPQTCPYETKYWHNKSGFLVEVHYDDWFNTGLTARDVDGLWQRAKTITVEGLPVRVPSLEDQLIHACMHAHYHGYTRLNWFSDLTLIVRDHASCLDWARLIETVRIEQNQAGVYYSLYFLNRLLGVSAPDAVLQAVRPDRFRRWWHARLLPEVQVLSLQPMPRPEFSFYFHPLVSRLLPDLLVMGRRREKIHYLLRLITPPRAWLRYYYRLADDRSLALHYVLHPLKLLYHYGKEIAGCLLDTRHKTG